MFLRICQIPLLLSATALAIGCSGSGSPAYNPDIGPFDEDGNYVEAWADTPPKRGSTARTTSPPAPKPVITKPKPVPAPTPRLAHTPAPAPILTPRPVTVAKVTPAPAAKPVVRSTPAPKPKVIKPKTIRHVVKKGDTLFGLAKRYGTTVSAIQSANGISGSTILTGKSYKIPQ